MSAAASAPKTVGSMLSDEDVVQSSAADADQMVLQTVVGLLPGHGHPQATMGLSLASLKGSWDPLSCPDWDNEKPSSQCILRIKRDIGTICTDPPPGILVAVNEDDMLRMDALIMGPEGTPYENGFFHFRLRMPPTYPLRPPRVRIMTTDSGKVRFNPNLYKCGKVCLSILGTWAGPSWSPAQTLTSVLLSIQSLLSSKPFHNEPGYEERATSFKSPQDVAQRSSVEYNKCIHHETLRVAVCGALEKRSELPPVMQEFLNSEFPSLYETYVATATEKLHLDGQPFQDPHGCNAGKFNYKSILERLKAVNDRIALETDSTEGGDDDAESDISDYDEELDGDVTTS